MKDKAGRHGSGSRESSACDRGVALVGREGKGALSAMRLSQQGGVHAKEPTQARNRPAIAC